MESKNIRADAITWFVNKFDLPTHNDFTSKFYTAKESWNNTKVWFFQITPDSIYSQTSQKIYRVCQNHLAGEPFLCFKVSTIFFLKNLTLLDVDQKERVVRIHLSAEAADMFKEVRGKGKVDFRSFLFS